MTTQIDTSPTGLRRIAADPYGYTDVFLTGVLEALAAEKESAAKQEPDGTLHIHWDHGTETRPLYLAPQPPAQPINMVLHCPACGMQHIDAPDEDAHAHSDGRESKWQSPPHRSHLCHGCGHIWRPADVPTNGVAAVKTKGKNDSSPAQPSEPPELSMSMFANRQDYEAAKAAPQPTPVDVPLPEPDGYLAMEEIYTASQMRAYAQAVLAAQKSNGCARNELVTALHGLASDFENSLYAFGGDIEGKRKAEGDIAHAMKVAAKHNYNGSGCLAAQPKREAVRLTDEQIKEAWKEKDWLSAIETAVLKANGLLP